MTHSLHLSPHFTAAEIAFLDSLNTPRRIQDFLDEIPYNGDPRNRSPLSVLRERQSHCLDGGLLGALALSRLGFPPLLVDILPEPGKDDDHILAIFVQEGGYGAVAKSNYAGLRYRDPVYRSLRELVMSYFDDYFNVDGEKTLRAYTRPLNLAQFDALGWQWNDAAADEIERRLQHRRAIPLLTPRQIASLERVDARAYAAGTLGINPDGVYKPRPTG